MIKVHSFTFNPFQENTYVVWNENKEALIIDPGCFFSHEETTLKQFISEHALKPVKLLNTHCHLDHVFGNKFIYEQYGLELHLHADEEKMLQSAPVSGKMYGTEFINYEGPRHYINEGEKILLGEDVFEIILAPGHSPGSICFYNQGASVLIAGDVLFYESIGRTDLPFGNHNQLISAIQQKIYALADDTVVYPGHGPATTVGHEKQHNPFVTAMV